MLIPPDLQFRLYPLRFHFLAKEPVSIPSGGAGNLFRGALGLALRGVSCTARCPGMSGQSASLCNVARECAYAQLFEPMRVDAGPSGLKDRPRGFVLRTAHIGESIPAGGLFHVDIHVFDTRPFAIGNIDKLQEAFRQIGLEGIGATRGRFDLIAVSRIDGCALESEPMSLSLKATGEACARVRIEFVTPTELKAGGVVVSRPEFGILFSRIRDRISTLRAIYGAGPTINRFQGARGTRGTDPSRSLFTDT